MQAASTQPIEIYLRIVGRDEGARDQATQQACRSSSMRRIFLTTTAGGRGWPHALAKRRDGSSGASAQRTLSLACQHVADAAGMGVWLWRL